MRTCEYVLDDLSYCGADAPRARLRLSDGGDVALCPHHGTVFRSYGLDVEEVGEDSDVAIPRDEAARKAFREEAETKPRLMPAVDAVRPIFKPGTLTAKGFTSDLEQLVEVPTPAMPVETPMLALHVEALEQLLEFVDDSGEIAHALDQARALSRTGSHTKTLDDGTPTAFETYRRMRGLP